MIAGKAQLWMALIFLSIALSSIFGRYYCGWICPINTLIRPVNFLRAKLGLNQKKIPAILKSEIPRKVVFALFLVGLGYTIYSITQGSKFPLPLIIIPFGLLITLLINENAWHRYLCPWGLLFSLTGRFAKLGFLANQCTSCSICKTACPGEAITIATGLGAVIDPTHCLVCGDCQTMCPANALAYQSVKNGRTFNDTILDKHKKIS
jgi:polyferredoxin